MTRTMYDSTNPFDIPTTASMVAGYVDGIYRWSPAGWNRFSGIKVRIAVFASTDDGIVLDVETGDATPAQSPGWVVRRRKVGIDPTVYCNRSTRPSVVSAFNAAGVALPHFWIADPNDGPVIPPGDVAVQFAAPPHSGGHWDLSVVSDFWPGVDTMEWTDSLPNPLFDKTVTNPADVRSHPAYTAEEYIQGAWVRTLTVPAIQAQASSNGSALSALSSMILALTTTVNNLVNEVNAIKAVLPVSTLTGTATVTVNLAEGAPSA